MRKILGSVLLLLLVACSTQQESETVDSQTHQISQAMVGTDPPVGDETEVIFLGLHIESGIGSIDPNPPSTGEADEDDEIDEDDGADGGTGDDGSTIWNIVITNNTFYSLNFSDFTVSPFASHTVQVHGSQTQPDDTVSPEPSVTIINRNNHPLISIDGLTVNLQ